MSWKKIRDELPHDISEDSKHAVLAYHNEIGTGMAYFYFHTEDIIEYIEENGVEYICSASFIPNSLDLDFQPCVINDIDITVPSLDSGGITHWMYLPKPQET